MGDDPPKIYVYRGEEPALELELPEEQAPGLRQSQVKISHRRAFLFCWRSQRLFSPNLDVTKKPQGAAFTSTPGRDLFHVQLPQVMICIGIRT
jgi:hypothetical protein